jgi:hypothetical protein
MSKSKLNMEDIHAVKKMLNIKTLNEDTYYLTQNGSLVYIFEIVKPILSFYPGSNVFGVYYNPKGKKWICSYWNQTGKSVDCFFDEMDIKQLLGLNLPACFLDNPNIPPILIETNREEVILLSPKSHFVPYTKPNKIGVRIGKIKDNGLWKIGEKTI